MPNSAAIVAIATILGGSYLLLRGMQQQGSGGGDISTDNSTEGTLMDLNGIANQVANAATPAPAGNPTNMSDAGINRLKNTERFSATPYPDHKGFSIGYGHLIKPGENLTYVSIGQATDILMADIAWAEASVSKAITVPITQGQFDVLVDFCFNVGGPPFERSTLVRKINTGDPTATNEFGRWIYSSGSIDQALIRRRAEDKQLYETATA